MKPTRLALLFAVLLTGAFAQSPRTSWKFRFSLGSTEDGMIAIYDGRPFSEETGYGWETVAAGFPGRFSVVVPPGNYRVTVQVGDFEHHTDTTVKAENRRLMLEPIVRDSTRETRTFTVNVRTPAMPPGNVLKLDTREWNPATNQAVTPTWDNKLTLQFSGARPAVSTLEIERVEDAITVFLIGDSTVTDQTVEPYGTWGMMLPRWFKPTVAVANHAESGLTVKAFRASRRWDKVMSEMKAGDYVFMQFGHNDLNVKGHDGIWPKEDTMGDWAYTHSEANTDYKWLLAAYAVEVKRRGGIPVIVSPMTKMNIRTGELNIAGLGDYPRAAAEAAKMADCAFIDLNAMSVALVTALGPTLAPKAYVDGLHSNTYGGYLFARCIVEGIKQAKLGLAAQLVDDAGQFDVNHPQPLPDDFLVPLEPRPPPPAPARAAGHSHPRPSARQTMKFTSLVLLGTLALMPVSQAHAQVAARPGPDGRPHKFELGTKQFLLDGSPLLIAAGEMHFGRVLPEDWAARIQQARAMGLNTVSFYLFWNLCEPREGEFTFTGLTDVRRVLKLCQENGLWVILRPGPYCCAEVEYGGIPWWTAKYPDVKIRTTDPKWLEWSRRYIGEVYKQVADLQVSKGGPLLMVQLDNEFGMIAGGNYDYLKSLQQIFREVGFDVPLFTCDPFLRPEATPGSLPAGVLRARNGLRNDRDFQSTTAAIGDSPVFVPELYTAWFSGWGQPIATRNSSLEQAKEWTGYVLSKDISFCYYMFHGGTTWGFFNGCNEYLPVQTSYDYGAPVDEAGRVTPKYRALRELLAAKFGTTPPPIPADPAVVALPAIRFTETVPLLATLPARPATHSEQPAAMEALEQAYGAVLYRKKFQTGLKGTLELRDARDYAIIMVNGRTVGEAFRGYGPDSNKISLDESGPATLDILVYNLGRISVIVSPRSQDRARKGLGGATLNGAELTGWDNYSLPLENAAGLTPSPAPPTGPTFYRARFNVSDPAGTFLDLRNWHFGVVWVNGHNLGRYWDRGGLRSLFLSSHFLTRGENEIVVLELQGAPKSAEIAGATNIIAEEAVPFAVKLDQPTRPAVTPPKPAGN